MQRVWNLSESVGQVMPSCPESAEAFLQSSTGSLSRFLPRNVNAVKHLEKWRELQLLRRRPAESDAMDEFREV